MGAATPMMMAASAGMNAIGAYNKTKAQKDMLNAEAGIADAQGSQAIIAGQSQEQSSDLKYGALFGQQRANLAANGVDLGSGSALDVLTSTKYLSQRDALTIRDNAARTAWGYQTEAGFDRSAANSLNPTAAALSSLMGSAGTVSQSWNQWKQAGGTSPLWMSSGG